jgi:hypothetical protein
VSSWGRAPGRLACGSDMASAGVEDGFWVNMHGSIRGTSATSTRTFGLAAAEEVPESEDPAVTTGSSFGARRMPVGQ